MSVGYPCDRGDEVCNMLLRFHKTIEKALSLLADY